MGKVVGIDDFPHLDSTQQYWVYNAADTTGTLEIAHTLRPRLTGSAAHVYGFERALQNPAFTMMRRGIKINTARRNAHVKQSERELEAAILKVDAHPLVQEVWDGVVKETGQCPVGTRKDKRHRWEKWPKGEPEDTRVCEDCGAARLVRSPFNANSSHQCQHFFYELLGCKPLRNKQGNVSADEEVLQRLQKANPKYAEVIGEVLSVRKLAKEAGFLKARISPAGRWHASFNVGATLSGRWSSSKNPQGMGNNAQNVSERHRDMFEADPGYELAYADLKQAESMVVAYLANDEEYMEAHHSGDVHTYVTRYMFPETQWSGDIPTDKKIAQTTYPPFDQEHDMRHHGKRNCFHPDVELLTPTGWKRVENCADTDTICSWDTDNTMRWEVPSDWTREFYTGELVEITGKNTRQLVTPNHRLPYLNNGKWGEKTADRLPKSGQFPRTGILDAGRPEPLARLHAATWCDGHHNNGGRTKQTIFQFKKPRKIERLRKLLIEACLCWRERITPYGATEFVVSEKLPKRLSWDMLQWDRASRAAFLDEVVHWDGDQVSRVFNNDLEGLEIIRTLLHLNEQIGSIGNHGTPQEGWQQTYLLHTNNRKRGYWGIVESSRVDYTGFVHCPTVSTGFVLIRYKGVISISGQTHGYAYGVSPQGTARIVRIPLEIAEFAHKALDKAFPNIKGVFHPEVIERVSQMLPLVTPVGRPILLLGRPHDPATYRKGYSVVPQSLVSDLVTMAIYAIWRDLDPHLVQVLGNAHDAIVMQWRKKDREEAIREVVRRMEIPVEIKGREMVIPVEVSVGANWGKFHPERNPEGQKTVHG
jgi:hypothetical protein